MTDVFFSYSSKDRERVRPIRDLLIAEGFDVFWDQEVPPGRDWDEWIRQQLKAARCAIVFWSEHSVQSRNVRHEAAIAWDAGKLIPVLLDPLTAEQFPMGHYTTQAIVPPAGGLGDGAKQRLLAEMVVKEVHHWMRRRLAELDGREKLEDSELALLRPAPTPTALFRLLHAAILFQLFGLCLFYAALNFNTMATTPIISAIPRNFFIIFSPIWLISAICLFYIGLDRRNFSIISLGVMEFICQLPVFLGASGIYVLFDTATAASLYCIILWVVFVAIFARFRRRLHAPASPVWSWGTA